MNDNQNILTWICNIVLQLRFVNRSRIRSNRSADETRIDCRIDITGHCIILIRILRRYTEHYTLQPSTLIFCCVSRSHSSKSGIQKQNIFLQSTQFFFYSYGSQHSSLQIRINLLKIFLAFLQMNNVIYMCGLQGRHVVIHFKHRYIKYTPMISNDKSSY